MTKIWWRGTIETVLLVHSFTWKSTFWQVMLWSMSITSEAMNKSVNECSIVYKSCTARQCLCFSVCLARSHNSGSDSFWQHNLRSIKVLLELTWEMSVNVRETRCSRFSARSTLICHRDRAPPVRAINAFYHSGSLAGCARCMQGKAH